MKVNIDNDKIKQSIHQKMASHNFNRACIEEVMTVIDKHYPPGEYEVPDFITVNGKVICSGPPF